MPRERGCAQLGRRVALLAALPGGPRPPRVLSLAIVHDLAEAEVGGITPHDRVAKEDKGDHGAGRDAEDCTPVA